MSGASFLVDAVRTSIADHLGVDEQILVGISGGVDSVVLAHVLVSIGRPIRLIHVHHGLRGAESDRDAEWVRGFAKALAVQFEIRSIRLSGRGSVQDEARELRYEAMVHAANDAGIAVIAVAHHRNDQAETVLLNLLRGAGPEGLRGMRTVRALPQGIRLFRPLLGVSRYAILEYAEKHSLTWREDASNEDVGYRRNALRHEVMPVLDRLSGGDAAANLARSAGLSGEYADSEIRPVISSLCDAAARPIHGGGGQLPTAALQGLPAVWQGRLFLEATRRWLPDAVGEAELTIRMQQLLSSQKGRHVPVNGGAVWRERDAIAFVPSRVVPADQELLVPGTVQWMLTTISADHGAVMHPSASSSVTINHTEGESLAVRSWTAGDRVWSARSNRMKKVKDVLSDAGVPSYARAAIPIVVQGDTVVWVVGCDGGEAAAQPLAYVTPAAHPPQPLAHVTLSVIAAT